MRSLNSFDRVYELIEEYLSDISEKVANRQRDAYNTLKQKLVKKNRIDLSKKFKRELTTLEKAGFQVQWPYLTPDVPEIKHLDNKFNEFFDLRRKIKIEIAAKIAKDPNISIPYLLEDASNKIKNFKFE